MKSIITTVILISTSFIAKAQSDERLYSTFSVGGLYNNHSGLGVKSGLSLAFTGSIAYQFNKNISFSLNSDFYTLPAYKVTNNYSLNGNVTIIPLYIGIIYKMPKKYLTPYFRIGAGGTIVTLPDASVDPKTNLINIESHTIVSPAFQSAVGLEWNWNVVKKITPFIELGFIHTTANIDLLDKGFTAYPLVIGFKMPF